MNDWPSRGTFKTWAITLMAEGKNDEEIRLETRMEIYLIKKYREEFEKERANKG